jgi:hypothetical protein
MNVKAQSCKVAAAWNFPYLTGDFTVDGGKGWDAGRGDGLASRVLRSTFFGMMHESILPSCLPCRE